MLATDCEWLRRNFRNEGHARVRGLQLEIEISPHPIGDRGLLGAEHGRVGHHNSIGSKSLPIAGDKRHQISAADLLLSLENEFDIDGQAASGPQIGLHGLHMRQHLPLVVAYAPPKKVFSADGRIERRRAPLVDRVGRLDVVMSVDEQRRPVGGSPPFAIYDRMAAS